MENSHEGIIEDEDFDFVQAELARRKALGGSYRGTSCFSAKLVCGDCGGFYGSKVWNSTRKYVVPYGNAIVNSAVEINAPRHI